jgi:hypothetical protein
MPLALACDNSQRILVTANPDGPIDGLVVTVASGDGTVQQGGNKADGTPLTPLQFFVNSGLAVADTVFTVDDAQHVGDTITLSVSAKAASTLGMLAGAPEPKVP